MSTKILTVVGITGSQGASVAESFLSEPGWTVRGISRDVGKASSKRWSDRGVDMHAADLSDVEALKKAFQGSHAIFGLTDFWAQMRAEANQQKAKEAGKTINQIAYDVEVQQGKNIVDAASATLDTLQVLVLSVLGDSVKWSKGRIAGNYHFEAKWRAVEYLESTYPELYGKTSLFQPASYLSGLDTLIKPKKTPDGTYVLSVPVDDDAQIPWYNADKDTGTLVKPLIVHHAPGKNLMGYGSWASMQDIARIWTRNINGGNSGDHDRQHPSTAAAAVVTTQRSSVDDLDKMIPGGVGRELGDMFEYMSHPGYYGGQEAVKALNLIHPSDLHITGLDTVEHYLEGKTL